ncbi:group II intron maturase-specific domain-containing protein [Enterobacter bugandensis]|uniref:group II intron maturase-specific domain-containing protein n=1 Tax=Enterobacter bugandensis TaxID=881260 RepID=UPI003969DFD2
MKTFLDKVRTTIEGNKTARTDTLIKRLNPLIRGWTNYHQHIVAAETFRYVNFQLWENYGDGVSGGIPRRVSGGYAANTSMQAGCSTQEMQTVATGCCTEHRQPQYGATSK